MVNTLNARIDPLVNMPRAVLMSIVVSVEDLATNVRDSRISALYVPHGYEPAAIKNPVGANLHLDLAVPRNLNNVLRRVDGSTYLAPYDWQSVADSIQVSWFGMFVNDWMVQNVLK